MKFDQEEIDLMEWLSDNGYSCKVDEAPIEEEEYNPIKSLRKELGLSQIKFANKLTIPLRTVQAWELGERHCPAYIIRLIEHWAKHSTAEHGDWL